MDMAYEQIERQRKQIDALKKLTNQGIVVNNNKIKSMCEDYAQMKRNISNLLNKVNN